MNALQAKIDSARRLIEMARVNYARPVVMCSFGKDSLVLLHLAMEWGSPRWPVLFHREPAGRPEKYRFAQEVIEQWSLTVYDYPPAGLSMTKGNGQIEVVNHYLQGEARCDLPTGIDPESEARIARGERFLCGRDDLLRKPTGRMDFPWDAVLVGHRGDDKCPVHGDLTLHAQVKQMPGGGDWIFPLHDWTEADVWDYIQAEDVPYQRTRYEQRREVENKALNPDYHCACTRCLDPDRGEVVECPKTGARITNIANQLRWVSLKQAYFGAPSSQPFNPATVQP